MLILRCQGNIQAKVPSGRKWKIKESVTQCWGGEWKQTHIPHTQLWKGRLLKMEGIVAVNVMEIKCTSNQHWEAVRSEVKWKCKWVWWPISRGKRCSKEKGIMYYLKGQRLSNKGITELALQLPNVILIKTGLMKWWVWIYDFIELKREWNMNNDRNSREPMLWRSFPTKWNEKWAGWSMGNGFMRGVLG